MASLTGILRPEASGNVARFLYPGPVPGPEAGRAALASPVRPSLSGIDVLPFSQPARTFSGDFYKVLSTPSGLFFTIGDVTGKGLEAAVLMSMIQETLESWESRIEAAEPLTALVAELDRMMLDESAPNRFASLIAGRLSEKGELELVNAGHSPPLVAGSPDGLRAITAHGALVGLLPGLEWTSCREHLLPGETLCLYTDGVIEAASPTGEEYGEARLARLLAREGRSSLRDLARRLLTDVEAHCAGPSQDDLTLLLIRRRASPGGSG